MMVLDASAMLAYLFRESGCDLVASHIENACISTVNLSEVAGRFVRDGIDAAPIIRNIASTAIEIVPFTWEQALQAANLVPKTKPYGLSLGDRACLGLAKERNLTVLTADRVWATIVGIDVDILPIR
jgi:PIN domain nuclease of toxin-antitoxin system